MPIRNSDIRLIDGDVTSAVEVIKEYLPNVGYRVDREKILQNCADIKAINLQQSVIKLYLTNSPQIVHWHIEKKSDEQVQIETKCDLFRKFRIFYYICLSLFLFGCSTFMILSSTYNFKSINSLALLDMYSSFGFTVLMAFLFFATAVFFYMRSISTFPYENFINQFYEILIQKGFTNKNDIHVGHSFPDMWKVLFLIGLFFSVTLFFLEIDPSIFKHTFLSVFLFGALTAMGLLIILLFMMNSRPSTKARMSFALSGFSLCIPIVFYNSPPFILSVTGNINYLFEKINTAGYSQQFMQFGSVIYIITIIVIFVIAGASLVNSIQLPIRLVMQIDKFSATNPNSHYHQSLLPENTFFIFNLLVVLLWGIFWTVKILSLYIAFSIFEKTIFGLNYLFDFKLAILFFENTKIVFMVLLQSKIGISATLLFHRMVMLIYSIPMIIFLFLILRKNLQSLIAEHFLISKQSNKHETIKKQLIGKTRKICKYAGIRLPIIRVIDSKDINAETKYVGFPIFKNILTVSKGAWDELNDQKDELDILLAHEIWHIKKHTFARRILCFLSDYSLFGNGFLALLQNSFQIEREADDFAVKWIVKKHQDENMAVDLLKSLLERIEENNLINAIFQTSSSLNFAMLKEGDCRSDFLKTFNDSSKIQKIKINLKLLYQIYFGEEIQSYFHPSISQRIDWVKEKYSADEAN